MTDVDSVPPFRPGAFLGDHLVTVWKPGTEVVFLGHSIGPLWKVGAVAVMCAPVVFLWFTRSEGSDDSDLLALAAIFAVVGLIGGIYGLVRPAVPRMVRLDWSERTLSIREDSGSTVIPMRDIAAIEVDRQHRMEPSSGGDTVGRGDYHCCEIRVHWRGPDGQLAAATLLETYHAGEPDGPYRLALPLVTDLAQALGVERRITDHRDLLVTSSP